MDGREELEDRLAPLSGSHGAWEASAVGRRSTWQGLIDPGARQGLQPTVARLDLRSHDRLHRCVTSTSWDDAGNDLMESGTGNDTMLGGTGTNTVNGECHREPREHRHRHPPGRIA